MYYRSSFIVLYNTVICFDIGCHVFILYIFWQGAVLTRCVLRAGVAGVKVSQQGQCVVHACEMSDLQYGVRCVQNAKVALLDNAIHHTQTSGKDSVVYGTVEYVKRI